MIRAKIDSKGLVLMKILTIEPNMIRIHALEEEKSAFETASDALDGAWLEVVAEERFAGMQCVFLADEEGIIKALPFNNNAKGILGRNLLGKVAVCKLGKGDFSGFTDAETQTLANVFHDRLNFAFFELDNE